MALSASVLDIEVEGLVYSTPFLEAINYGYFLSNFFERISINETAPDPHFL